MTSIMEAVSNSHLPSLLICKTHKLVKENHAWSGEHSGDNGVTVSEWLTGGEMWDNGKKCSVTVWSGRGEECEHNHENM